MPTDHEQRILAGQACYEAAINVYLPLGFSVLCCCDPDHIAVGKNHAQHCDSPGKAPMHPWKAFQERNPTGAEVAAWWQSYPLGNVGCALGQVSGLVRIDVDGPEGEALLAEWSQGDLPATWIFQSSPGSRGLLYRWPAEQPCRSTTRALPGDHREVRLMANGSQTVLPPSRHPSGAQYHWLPNAGPDDLRLAMAPLWLQERLRPPPLVPRIPSTSSAHTLPVRARIEEALGAFPSSDAAYDDWLSIGMALHSTGEDWARDVWENWSQLSEKYDGIKQEKSWQSFQANGGVSLGSLYYLAQQAGWKPSQNGPIHHAEELSSDEEDDRPIPYRPNRQALQSPVPPLPQFAVLDPRLADGAAPWLEAYVAHSQRWSPRAATSFHQGVGLWVLATVAARRISVEMGSPIYPVLFFALVARSTLFAKTTTAKLGRDAIRAAGCQHLLGADRSTPQALLRSMTGPVPDNYEKLPDDEQARIRARIGNAGQRGWFYEEWGGMLHQMRRADSPMAEFHSLLRVLDDGYDSYTSETIARGLEEVHAPYLALLTNATPHDLAKFMTPGADWWHDGFWPRFAFLTPGQDEFPSTDIRPLGRSTLPSALIVALHDWHRRLGIPQVEMEEIRDNKDKPTGTYRANVSHPVYPVLTLSPPVYSAYNAYNQAMIRMLTLGEVPNDFEACYGRFHDKALRVSMLLASLAGQDTITMPYWAYAQQITEQWRMNLHVMVEIARESTPASPLEQKEARIESMLIRRGPLSVRDLRRALNMSTTEMGQYLQAMTRGERIMTFKEGKKTLVAIPQDAMPPDDQEGTNSDRDIPF